MSLHSRTNMAQPERSCMQGNAGLCWYLGKVFRGSAMLQCTGCRFPQDDTAYASQVTLVGWNCFRTTKGTLLQSGIYPYTGIHCQPACLSGDEAKSHHSLPSNATCIMRVLVESGRCTCNTQKRDLVHGAVFAGLTESHLGLRLTSHLMLSIPAIDRCRTLAAAWQG